MTTGPGGKRCGTAAAEAPRSVSLSVLPTKPARVSMGRSRTSRWRAAVLIGVNVLMLAHIGVWLWSVRHGSGETVSPVEPSESMYTIEVGKVNAGFVFFAAALLATFVFGRFFCGWGCHIVALQDLCSHWMNKLGVRPKPLRTRVLLLAPLLLALYMFVWPTFKRLALVPLEGRIAAWVRRADPARAEPWTFPEWLVDLPRQPHPGFSNAFMVEDFWHTFPRDWYVIVPFLGVCGFAAVYFLGSKGFCTYGCPYGGFFAPVDKVSVGRIVVDHDKCEQCGHCTAVCTSNVRVSQEVHDYGMVVDPGCMKCMDCVSVCPNDALRFSFARPAVLKKAFSEEARAGTVKRPEYDVPLWQDVALLVLCIAFFIGFRGMFNKVPLLMAGGMGLAAGFIAWKLWSMATLPNVRLQSLQLKLKGRLKPAGVVVAVLGLAYLAAGAWGGVVKGVQIAANRYDLRVKTPLNTVFAPGYAPAEKDAANAREALRLLRLAGPISEGGIGWAHSQAQSLRMSWHSAVMGDLAEAERHLRRAIGGDLPAAPAWVFQLAMIRQRRGATPEEVRADLLRIVEESPHLFEVRLALAEDSLGRRDSEGAAALAGAVLGDTRRVLKPGPGVRVQAASVLLRAGRSEAGMEALEDALERAVKKKEWGALVQGAETLLQFNRADAAAHHAEALLGVRKRPAPALQMHAVSILLRAGKGEEALGHLPGVLSHEKPRPDAVVLTQIGDLYMQAGRLAEAEATLARAVQEYPSAAFAHFTRAQALALGQKNDAALASLNEAVRLEPQNPSYLGAKAQLLNLMGRTLEAQQAAQEAQGAAQRQGQPGR